MASDSLVASDRSRSAVPLLRVKLDRSLAPMQATGSIVPNFVCPISNAPCSLEITAECVETPESGVTTTRHESEVVYRDSAGRLRWDLNHPAPELNEPGDVIQIVDATAGFIAVLIPIAKCAFRQTFPAGSLGPNPPGASILGGPAAALSLEPGKKTIKKKTLGKQVIEGIEFEGELTTLTVAGERTVVVTDESWFSKELGLYGLRITTSRGRKTTSKIQKVDRNEPDPSLFAIPAEYVIQDNSFGAPDIVTPDIAAPDIAAPDIVTPDIAAPDIAAPDVAAPDK